MQLRPSRVCFLLTLACLSFAAAPAAPAARADGEGALRVTGDLQQWHKVTVELAGPFAAEDATPNPFTDYRFDVTFTHASGAPSYTVPGYFAADGDAANTSATSGRVWRAHFAPDRTGEWRVVVAFHHGPAVAVEGGGTPLTPFHGQRTRFQVTPNDKAAPDFRARGRLEYVGGHHLRFAGDGSYFLKAGPDSPETMLAYVDFDGTVGPKPEAPLKTWAKHVADWKAGDPTWAGGKGKGLIGALNYLADEGLNSVSFLPYNAGGDGDNVWPFVARDQKLRYDCSKLEQWAIVLDHAQSLGIHLHFKLQENEMDDHRLGADREPKVIPEALDGGKLGLERKLYLRELVARFGHALALNWNLGEENTQTVEEQRDMAGYLRELHYYPSNIVLHTFPDEQWRVYVPLLRTETALTGLSLQNHWADTHAWTVTWLRASRAAGRPWVVAADEQGHWGYGALPDPGYAGFAGTVNDGRRTYSLHDVRKLVLWGNLMAGGAGVEYYFGYRTPDHDINSEDWRSRDQSWDYCRIALEFFQEHQIPFWEMTNADELVGNPILTDANFCLMKPKELYLVYLPWGGGARLDLSQESGAFSLHWFNPRTGGALVQTQMAEVRGGGFVKTGEPPSDPQDDWLVILRPLAGAKR